MRAVVAGHWGDRKVLENYAEGEGKCVIYL